MKINYYFPSRLLLVPVTIKMGKITGDSVIAGWYNPRTGETSKIGEFLNSGSTEFIPYGISKELNWMKTGRGCDWVLVLDGF